MNYKSRCCFLSLLVKVDGPWAIKFAVGNKPALTGTKLTQTYYCGKGYFEIDIEEGDDPRLEL